MKNTRKLAICAVMCAISVVFTRLLSFQIPIAGLPVIRIGFGSIPIIIAGIVCGAFWGGVVGAVADLFGCLLNLMGTTFFPGFTLSAALTGIIPALCIKYILRPHRHKKRLVSTVSICGAVVINEALVSLMLNTLWLCIMYGQGFIVLVGPRIISVVCMMFINSFFTCLILRAMLHLPMAGLYNPYAVRNAQG